MISRKRDEAIVIGHDVEVRVIRVGREGVRLGIVAPPHVSVHRTEIYELVRQENEAAARTFPSTAGFVETIRRRMEP